MRVCSFENPPGGRRDEHDVVGSKKHAGRIRDEGNDEYVFDPMGDLHINLDIYVIAIKVANDVLRPVLGVQVCDLLDISRQSAFSTH